MKEACDEERNLRHCREGACISWKALSNDLDGAIDRDMVYVVGGEELQVKSNSQSHQRFTRLERGNTAADATRGGTEIKSSSCKKLQELGPIRDFSKSC